VTDRVQLKEPGSELVMAVLRAKPETVDRTDYWLFSGSHKEIMVPATSVKGRLARMNVGAAADLVGKTVKFARSTKTNLGGKPYWEMDIATEAEAKAALNGNGASAGTAAPASAGTAGASSPKSYADIYMKATDFIIEKIVPKYRAAKLEPTANDVHAMVSTLFIPKSKE
jgi:hypothetical protein